MLVAAGSSSDDDLAWPTSAADLAAKVHFETRPEVHKESADFFRAQKQARYAEEQQRREKDRKLKGEQTESWRVQWLEANQLPFPKTHAETVESLLEWLDMAELRAEAKIEAVAGGLWPREWMHERQRELASVALGVRRGQGHGSETGEKKIS